MKYNFIWQTVDGDQTNFEYEYLTKLVFKNINIKEHFDNGNLSQILDDSVIIYSNNQNYPSSEFINYLKKFKENNYKFYLIHLSNESLGHNTDYYDLAEKVFRNYFDTNIKNSNVVYIPLGFKSGYLNKDFKIENFKKKKYDFSFMGQLKSDRQELYEILKNKNAFTHLTYSWNCTSSLNCTEVSEIYKQTKFTPCPMGWVHPDSFRIMESLEWGSIPIIKKYDNFDYHNNVYGETPLPKINCWGELDKFDSMNNYDYLELFENVFSWYGQFREKTYLT